jgi:hypothetical protein
LIGSNPYAPFIDKNIEMNLKATFLFLAILFSRSAYSQDSSAVDSVKRILSQRYEALGQAMDSRDTSKIFSFRTDDFHTIGPDGRVLDNVMMKEYSRQFITNNLPPYNTKIIILNLRLSYNKIVAVADVFQEATRKRELAGKLREVKTSVLQTETWIFENNQWKLKLVDNVHDQKRFVDGKRVDPAKPYNPDDPPYDPDKNK